MHDPNGIIKARLASLLAPDSMARRSRQLSFFAITLQPDVHNAVQYFGIEGNSGLQLLSKELDSGD